MPTFFSGPAGRVAQCTDRHTQGTINLVGLSPSSANISFTRQQSIITRMTVAHQCNFQFLHTIGNELYIYVFGDRIGQITLAGLSFSANASGSNSDHGFGSMIRWYGDHRVAVRSDPVVVSIGTRTNFEGFLVGFSGDVINPDTRITQWSANIMVLPT